jgi:hypothetical protein
MFNEVRIRWIKIAVGLVFALLLVILFLRSPGIGKKGADEGLEPRPDVVEWIEKHYGHDLRKKAALTRLAEGHQYILTHPDAEIEADQKDAMALECYFIAFERKPIRMDGIPVFEVLAAQSFNTLDRARKRNAYLGRLSGKVLELGKVDSWEEQCEKPLWPKPAY